MNLTGDAGKRLDHFLQEHLPQFSRSRLQSWIKEGRVLVNGSAAKASLVLRGGEGVEVSPADEVPLLAAPEDLPLEILYQDAAVIAAPRQEDAKQRNDTESGTVHGGRVSASCLSNGIAWASVRE